MRTLHFTPVESLLDIAPKNGVHQPEPRPHPATRLAGSEHPRTDGKATSEAPTPTEPASRKAVAKDAGAIRQGPGSHGAQVDRSRRQATKARAEVNLVRQPVANVIDALSAAAREAGLITEQMKNVIHSSERHSNLTVARGAALRFIGFVDIMLRHEEEAQ